MRFLCLNLSFNVKSVLFYCLSVAKKLWSFYLPLETFLELIWIMEGVVQKLDLGSNF